MTRTQKRAGLAAAALIAMAAIAWLAIGFFGVHTLFFDEEVSEENPFADLLESSAPAADDVADETVPDSSVDDASDSEEAPVEEGSPESVPEVEPDEAVADEVGESEPVEPEPTEPPAVPQVRTIASGSLVDHDHQGEGSVNVLTDGTQTFVRFEDDFAVDNGPDLNVYLVRGAEADGDPDLFDDDFIDLGDLKGNIGAQNYEVPQGVDIGEYDVVVIWCVRFGVAFNAAALTA